MICFNHFHDHRAFREGNTLMRVLYITRWVVVGIFIASIFATLFALVVRLIWNAVMPDVFGLPGITFWQAFGMILLAKLLFGGGWNRFRGIHNHSGRRFPMNTETPFSMQHCGDYEQYWREEGKTAFEAYLKKRENAGNQDS